jgi:hypothetical protein
MDAREGEGMTHYDNEVRALRDVCEGISQGSFNLVSETSEESLDSWRHGRIPKTSYSIQSKNERLSFEMIAKTALTLIDERLANWLISAEGQAAQKKAIASELFIGAMNPQFTPEAAQEKADQQFNPFAAVIEVLERNGYEVKKK